MDFDVKVKKRNEEALLGSEHAFLSILNTSPCCYCGTHIFREPKTRDASIVP